MKGSMEIPTIRLTEGRVEMIDQTRLPAEYIILSLSTVNEVCDAIKRLVIRGAPALGVAGAFGLVLAVEEKWRKEGSYYFDWQSVNCAAFPPEVTPRDIRTVIVEASITIGKTRPTAVNLFWALDRMQKVCDRDWSSAAGLLEALHREAIDIYEEDLDMCRRLGAIGAELLQDGDVVMTHCNAGGLATSGFGTALGVIFAAVESGKKISVFADETRPLLQGARLTAWECRKRDIPVRIACEGAAGHLMSNGLVSSIIVGADRIAANGDTANKIGTLNLAIIAKRYGVPFYVAAPSSTVDLSIANGAHIPIEMRDEEEVKKCFGVQIAPQDADAINPAFDVTPCELISAIITEQKIFYPPFQNLA
ncbi:MAG: S-methyl-5-thioribose-1-phosphate isomerase [Candidatus Latescibacterota bacterium]